MGIVGGVLSSKLPSARIALPCGTEICLTKVTSAGCGMLGPFAIAPDTGGAHPTKIESMRTAAYTAAVMAQGRCAIRVRQLSDASDSAKWFRGHRPR